MKKYLEKNQEKSGSTFEYIGGLLVLKNKEWIFCL